MPERTRRVYVAVNENGRRIGGTHHNSTISDETVNRLRELHEEQGLGYRRLAKMFGLSRAAVQKICKYRLRQQLPSGWRRIK